MEQSNKFFATAKPLSLFLRVAIPGLISMLAMSLYQASEGAFVGRILGESAFAAISIGMPIVMINFSLSDLIGVGSSAPIAVALGRHDVKKACNIFSCSVIMIFMVAILSGVLIYFTAPFFAAVMGAEGELAALAVRYVRVYASLGPLTTVVFAVDNYLRISGFVKGSMSLNVFMSLLTVGFLALFIGVFKMNVEGAALASSLAMFICASIALSVFVRKKAILKFTRPRFSFRMIREITACGTPMFLSNIAGRVTAIFMNAALLRIGGQTAVAACSVLMYVSGVVEPMLYGMSDSVQPAVGYNWGAGNLKRVSGITKVSFSICGLVSVFCASLMFIIPKPLVSIFVDGAKEPELMKLSIHAMPLFGLAFLLGWFCFAVQGFFAAVEKPLFATIVSICFAIVFPIALIYALSPLGLDGLWLNYLGRAILTSIVAVLLILVAQRQMKRCIDSLAQKPASEDSDT